MIRAQAEWEDQRLQYRQELTELCAGKTYHIITYGCQMNVNDSEKIAGLLEEVGCAHTPQPQQSDILLFNTCCVREGAEDRVAGNIGALREIKEGRPDMVLGVCGCMMQQPDEAQRFMKRFPHVDLVFGTHDLHMLYEMFYDALHHKRRVMVRENEGIVEDLPIIRRGGPIASITIMYGCNNFCSYCIVPHVRGRERSRSMEDILKEVHACVEEGAKEILLLGQNVNSYGAGMEGYPTFSNLLRAIHPIDGLERIRFMTSHPKDMSDDLADAMGEYPKLMPHLHIPVQSGSDAVLKRMNRGYTAAHYLSRIDRIRKAVPHISLTTDVIVGFPGETEQDFQATLDLMKKVGFRAAYTFMYSARSGTPAADMDQQVPLPVKKDRLKRLNDLQKGITGRILDEDVGKIYRVLIEGAASKGKGRLHGRTPQGQGIHFPAEGHKVGDIVSVRVTRNAVHTLAGTIEKED